VPQKFTCDERQTEPTHHSVPTFCFPMMTNLPDENFVHGGDRRSVADDSQRRPAAVELGKQLPELRLAVRRQNVTEFGADVAMKTGTC